MRRAIVLVLILLWVTMGIAAAQDCGPDTCTPTPTPSETPTPTPNTIQIFTLPTSINDEGTPSAPQSAQFAFSADGGQVVIAGELMVLIVSLWAMFTIWIFVRPRGSSRKAAPNE